MPVNWESIKLRHNIQDTYLCPECLDLLYVASISGRLATVAAGVYLVHVGKKSECSRWDVHPYLILPSKSGGSAVIRIPHVRCEIDNKEPEFEIMPCRLRIKWRHYPYLTLNSGPVRNCTSGIIEPIAKYTIFL